MAFQRVINGKSVLIIGSVIPCCALYYFYHRRHRCPRPRTTVEAAPISSRAHGLSKPNESPYYLGLEMARDDPYHEDLNPNGVMQLGLADNLLCLDLIQQWVAKNWDTSIGSDSKLGIKSIAPYQPLDGLVDLKLAMANFMSTVMGNVDFDPSRLVLTSGATPALEILSFCLADHGDAFLIPAPYYSGFDRDLVRTGVQLIPVHCHSSENFSLTSTALNHAYNDATKRGLKIRGIRFSNPSNPVGNVLSRETLYTILSFAREKNIHIISDEIYAGSVYGNEEFISMAEIVRGKDDLDKQRVHIIYGISKGLSLAGFRVGSIYTFNDNVLTAAKKLSTFSSISAPTQRLLISMLSNEVFIQEYMEAKEMKLKKMHDLFVAGLEQLRIPFAKSDAGLFCWVDMSGLIKPSNEEGEMDLWSKLLNVGKLFLIPGSVFHCAEPGWFRCCFSTLTEQDIPLVMKRIQKVCGISDLSMERSAVE
ncbi:hypothetical protein RND81_12G120200 [Saponaria officinalis]|uniref:Aminotransferase class I/classII large domain-containing protein n=1 Tax=Saponaria officinalis TaxID=3572 RepID=A0AAW1H9M1_SAPOF